ncbi:MAG: hypothetical protein Q9M36_02730 [Sulfurovum sp.]|nr:hypothetical protein [Sulfurovum sp.]
MKKKNSLIVAILVTAVLFVGCTDDSVSFSDGIVVLEDGEVVGQARADKRSFDRGVKIYDEKGEVSGFVDTDGLAYRGIETSKEVCGGELVGLCNDEALTDGLLTGTCNLSSFPTEAGLIQPYHSFSCDIENI